MVMVNYKYEKNPFQRYLPRHIHIYSHKAIHPKIFWILVRTPNQNILLEYCLHVPCLAHQNQNIQGNGFL